MPMCVAPLRPQSLRPRWGTAREAANPFGESRQLRFRAVPHRKGSCPRRHAFLQFQFTRCGINLVRPMLQIELLETTYVYIRPCAAI